MDERKRKKIIKSFMVGGFEKILHQGVEFCKDLFEKEMKINVSNEARKLNRIT